MTSPAVFLDRDGTINVEVDYLSDPTDLVLIDGAAQAIARLNQAGFLCIVITNQSGIARGILSEERLAEIHGRLDEMLREAGAHIDHYEYCPHHPDHGEAPYRRACDCRKPHPGMYRKAREAMNVDLPGSWAVGDSPRDLQAAAQLSVPGFLVSTGKSVTQASREEFKVVADLSEAVDRILAKD